jgi:glycosyltransferase involved in cell wall biosynthesis
MNSILKNIISERKFLVADDLLISLYQSNDLFVFPTYLKEAHRGLEAMAASCQCVGYVQLPN